MKKLISTIIIIISFSICLAFHSFGVNSAEDLSGEIKGELFDIIDKDVLDILESISISEDSFGEIYSFSLKNISDFFSETLSQKVKACLGDISLLLCAVLIVGVISSFLSDGKKDNLISLLGTVCVTLLIITQTKNCLSAALSVLRLSGSFTLSFVPIYTLIISFAGNTASALTYNSLVMAFGEVLSSFISYFSADLLGVFFCLTISFSLNENINIGRFISAVNKTVSVVLGLLSGLFTGFLSIKGILSASLDSVSVKGIRFLISSLIPVVGSAISDAYSSLVGSINLIKGSVALVGILVIIIINLPVILQTLIYYLSFTILGHISDMICTSRVGDTLRCFATGIKILLLLCVFEMFILIISTGIMLTLKGMT